MFIIPNRNNYSTLVSDGKDYDRIINLADQLFFNLSCSLVPPSSYQDEMKDRNLKKIILWHVRTLKVSLLAVLVLDWFRFET